MMTSLDEDVKNDINFQADNLKPKGSIKNSLTFLKLKVYKTNELISRYNDIVHDQELLKKNIDILQKEKNDVLNKYTSCQAEILKLNLDLANHQTTIENQKDEIQKLDIKIKGDEKSFEQVNFKVVNLEKEAEKLKSEKKQLEQVKLKIVNLEKEVEKLKSEKKQLQQEIKTKGLLLKKAEKKVKTSEISVQTDHSISPKETSTLDNQKFFPTDTLDKSTLTDRPSYEEEPFPFFCSRCQIYIPNPLEGICKEMSIVPEPLSDIPSPPDSPIKSRRSMSFDNSQNSLQPKIVSDMNSYENQNVFSKNTTNQTALINLEHLEKRISSLEKTIKTSKKRNNQHHCCNNETLSQVFGFLQSWNPSNNQNQTGLASFSKKKPVKRLQRNKSIKCKKKKSLKNKWVVENDNKKKIRLSESQLFGSSSSDDASDNEDFMTPQVIGTSTSKLIQNSQEFYQNKNHTSHQTNIDNSRLGSLDEQMEIEDSFYIQSKQGKKENCNISIASKSAGDSPLQSSINKNDEVNQFERCISKIPQNNFLEVNKEENTVSKDEHLKKLVYSSNENLSDTSQNSVKNNYSEPKIDEGISDSEELNMKIEKPAFVFKKNDENRDSESISISLNNPVEANNVIKLNLNYGKRKQSSYPTIDPKRTKLIRKIRNLGNSSRNVLKSSVNCSFLKSNGVGLKLNLDRQKIDSSETNIISLPKKKRIAHIPKNKNSGDHMGSKETFFMEKGEIKPSKVDNNQDIISECQLLNNSNHKTDHPRLVSEILSISEHRIPNDSKAENSQIRPTSSSDEKITQNSEIEQSYKLHTNFSSKSEKENLSILSKVGNTIPQSDKIDYATCPHPTSAKSLPDSNISDITINDISQELSKTKQNDSILSSEIKEIINIHEFTTNIQQTNLIGTKDQPNLDQELSEIIDTKQPPVSIDFSIANNQMDQSLNPNEETIKHGEVSDKLNKSEICPPKNKSKSLNVLQKDENETSRLNTTNYANSLHEACGLILTDSSNSNTSDVIVSAKSKDIPENIDTVEQSISTLFDINPLSSASECTISTKCINLNGADIVAESASTNVTSISNDLPKTNKQIDQILNSDNTTIQNLQIAEFNESKIYSPKNKCRNSKISKETEESRMSEPDTMHYGNSFYETYGLSLTDSSNSISNTSDMMIDENSRTMSQDYNTSQNKSSYSLSKETKINNLNEFTNDIQQTDFSIMYNAENTSSNVIATNVNNIPKELTSTDNDMNTIEDIDYRGNESRESVTIVDPTKSEILVVCPDTVSFNDSSEIVADFNVLPPDYTITERMKNRFINEITKKEDIEDIETIEFDLSISGEKNSTQETTQQVSYDIQEKNISSALKQSEENSYVKNAQEIFNPDNLANVSNILDLKSLEGSLRNNKLHQSKNIERKIQNSKQKKVSFGLSPTTSSKSQKKGSPSADVDHIDEAIDRVIQDSLEDEQPVIRRLRSNSSIKMSPKAQSKSQFRMKEASPLPSTSTVVLTLNKYLEKSKLGRNNIIVRNKMKNDQITTQIIIQELDILIKAEPWTSEIQSAILEKLLNLKEPEICALTIINYFESFVSKTLNIQLDRTHTPPAPLMTQMEQKLLTLILGIKKSVPDFDELVIGGLRYSVFKLGPPAKETVVECLFRLLLVLIKLRKDRERARILLVDAMYSLNMRAINVLYIAVTAWPEIFPHYENTSGDVIVKTIIFIIFTTSTDIQYSRLITLRKHLHQYYGYPADGYFRDAFKLELMQALQDNVDGADVAILLLCKKADSEWSFEKVINGGLLHMIVSRDHPHTIKLLQLLGNIIRAYPASDKNGFISKLLPQLTGLLDNELVTTDIQEGALSALLDIGRFQYETVAKCILRCPSERPLQSSTLEKLESFISSRDPPWWQKFIKVNFLK